VPVTTDEPERCTLSIRVEAEASDAKAPVGPLGVAPVVVTPESERFLIRAPERLPNKPPGDEDAPPLRVRLEIEYPFPFRLPLKESVFANGENGFTEAQSIELLSSKWVAAKLAPTH
jgi:hypothetical protein